MADLKRVSPADAKALVDEGYLYLDVRSEAEFASDHPAGAYNIPLMHLGPGGMSPNADFLRVTAAAIPKDAKVVVGCKTGGRSQRAAMVMLQNGWTDVVDQRAGFDGARDPFGGGVEAGWKSAGLPTETGDGGDRGYAALAKK